MIKHASLLEMCFTIKRASLLNCALKSFYETGFVKKSGLGKSSHAVLKIPSDFPTSSKN
jgi:hypothetical protein